MDLTVVKVGGSLTSGGGPDPAAALRRLGRELGRLGAAHRLLLVPGGGAFADLVRDHDRRFHLAPATAHRMALLAMDQYGCLLGDLVPGARLSRRLGVGRAADRGRTVILLPAALIEAADPLPNSWAVTADSIAAFVAGRVRATRLVLLKATEGLLSDRGDLVERVTVAELGALRPAGRLAAVDPYLPVTLAGWGREAWVLSGHHPERLAELLRGGAARGTRITP